MGSNKHGIGSRIMRSEVGGFSARFAFLKGTFLHPQWFAHRHEKSLFEFIVGQTGMRVLDVGCSDQRIKKSLPVNCEYTGLDYYSTATEWYKTRPTIYGDAHALPFADAQFDTVLLLDVLEHLEAPDACMKEIERILKNGGNFFLKVPFMYPIHDAPVDFHRWTRFGLLQLVRRHGFRVVIDRHIGEPVETAALLTNIAWSKTVLRWARSSNPMMLLGLLLPPAVMLTNLLSKIMSSVSASDDMMPHGYLLVLQKNGRDKTST